MTNSAMLYKKIADSGIKICYLCRKCCISEQTFRRKVTSKNEFTASEISMISKLLSLSIEERDTIFFANNGDFHSPSAKDCS